MNMIDLLAQDIVTRTALGEKCIIEPSENDSYRISGLIFDWTFELEGQSHRCIINSGGSSTGGGVAKVLTSPSCTKERR